MWSCSTGDMLSQNSRAWLKWSSKDAESSRTLAPAGDRLGHVEEGALGVAGHERAATVERVGSVRRHTTVDGGLVHAVAQHVVDRRVRAVDRQLVEVRSAEPRQLGVDVGEEPHLEQRVVGDVDAGHEVADVEGDLLGLGEEVRRRARRASAARAAAPGRAPRAPAWWGRAGRCPRRSGRGCPRRPGCRAPTAGRRPTRSRRRGRGGGSRGRCRRGAGPPPRSASARPAAASSGT